jgi:hypothetical protein
MMTVVVSGEVAQPLIVFAAMVMFWFGENVAGYRVTIRCLIKFVMYFTWEGVRFDAERSLNLVWRPNNFS